MIKGTIISVSRWAGNKIGHGANECYEPDPQDAVTVWITGKSLAESRGCVACYRYEVEEPAGLTMYENMRRLNVFVER